MAQPTNPTLSQYSFSLRFPFLLWAGRRIYNSRRSVSSPNVCPALRRLFCFLWLWQASLFVRSELLLPTGRARGLYLHLSCPVGALDWYWRHQTWDTLLPLETSVYLWWLPVRWWDLSEGSRVFSREWHRVWSRWEEAGRTVWTADGAARETWLQRVPTTRYRSSVDPLYYQGE